MPAFIMCPLLFAEGDKISNPYWYKHPMAKWCIKVNGSEKFRVSLPAHNIQSIFFSCINVSTTTNIYCVDS